MMMVVSHAFRRSRSFQLFLSLIFAGEVVFALARPYNLIIMILHGFLFMDRRLDCLTKLLPTTKHHYTPTISRKGFSSSRVAYYPNSVSSFQTSFLMRSGDINPNPGPVNSSAANPEPRQDGFNLILCKRSQYRQQTRPT